MPVLPYILIILYTLNPGESRVVSKWDISSTRNDLCSDCTQIMELVTDMSSHKHTQELVSRTLSGMCRRLPGPEERARCETQLVKYLPHALQHPTTHMKTGELCLVLGACSVRPEEGVPSRLTGADASSDAPYSSSSPGVHDGPQCTFCVLFIKKLESMLPEERTEDAIVKLMGDVCSLLPATYEDQCDQFIAKYGKQVVSFLLQYAAPRYICVLLHLCLFKASPSQEAPLLSDCEACQTLAVLTRFYLGTNITEAQNSSVLQSVCLQHPSAIPQCGALSRLYGARLVKALGPQMDLLEVCQRSDLCVEEEEQRPLGKDRCAWGPSYHCRDRKTARECGSVAFCQTFMWN